MRHRDHVHVGFKKNWVYSTCGTQVISNERHHFAWEKFYTKRMGWKVVHWWGWKLPLAQMLIVEMTLNVQLCTWREREIKQASKRHLHDWDLLASIVRVKPQPDYILLAIRQDYEEVVP